MNRNKALETVFSGQGFNSSNTLDSIVSTVASGLGGAFAQWAGRDTAAARSAGSGAASRAYQRETKDATAAAFNKLAAADNAKKQAEAAKAEVARKAFAPKPAKGMFAVPMSESNKLNRMLGMPTQEASH